MWTAHELPLPVEESDTYTALPAPGWLLHGTRHDGIVRLVNHGSDHHPPAPGTADIEAGADPDEGAGADDPHYAKLAYSTATAPQSAPHALARNTDGHLALLAPDGTPSRRRRIHPLRCEDRVASSWSTARLPGDERGYRIETTSVLHGPWEIRVHRVEAPEGAVVREGGHAVGDAQSPFASSGPDWALARTAEGLSSALVALYGWDGGEEGAAVARDVETHAYGPYSAVPYLRSAPRAGGRSIHVSLVVLSRDRVHPEALRTAVRVRVDGEAVVLTFLDGRTVEA